jgi:hypothetical protein
VRKKLSLQDKKLIEDASVALAKSIEGDITVAVERVRESSDTLGRLDPSLVRAYLHRSYVADEDTRNLWNSREQNSEAFADKVGHVAKALGAAVDSLHGSDNYADDGVADEGVRKVVGRLKKAADLPASFPSSLVETLLLDAVEGNADADAAWTAQDQDPVRWGMHEREIGHRLRHLANDLTTRTRPSMDELEIDGEKLTPVDLFQMSDRDFKKLTKALERRTERAKAEGGRSR